MTTRVHGDEAHATQSSAPVHKTRRPVQQPEAESHLLISLTAFALTVIATRVFLQLAGYPQVGNAVLHIAHAIWGGLLLFAAVLVALVLANQWALRATAVLSGIGVGLFIDEVGKFITQKNDYFFPPAAPLIYSLFLLTVLLFLLVRRARQNNPRASMYRALTGLRELLDNDLDAVEQQRLLADLQEGRNSSQPHVAGLAGHLITYLEQNLLPTVPHRPGLWARMRMRAQGVVEQTGRKNHLRLILIITAILGINATLTVLVLVWSWLSPEVGELVVTGWLLTEAEALSIQDPIWLVVRLALQTVLGLMYLLSFLRCWRGYEASGLNLAIFASLLSLTGLQLLAFYLDQFGALGEVLATLVLFILLITYRSTYIEQAQDVEAPSGRA